MLALPLGAIDSWFFFSPFSFEPSSFTLRSILAHGAILSSASNVVFERSPFHSPYSPLRYYPFTSALCSRCMSTVRPAHRMEPSSRVLNRHCLDTFLELSLDDPDQFSSPPIFALINWPW